MKKSFSTRHQGLLLVGRTPNRGNRTSRSKSRFSGRIRDLVRIGTAAAIALLGQPILAGCATGTFRYERLSERADGVDLRGLDDLVADSSVEVDRGSVRYDFTVERDEYRLGANDVLDVFVMQHPEMSSQRVGMGEIAGTTIRKDGHVYLPVVGRVKAAGLTVTEFEVALKSAAAKYVVDPEVHVEILEHESQKFHVLGHVKAPGSFPVDGDTTLIEALTLAGGLGESGSLEGATVVRNGQLLPIDLAALVKGGDVSRNVYMRKGDLVYVPNASTLKVFVLGEVKTPTPVPLTDGRLSLAEALATAGGPTPARARRELAVIRGGFAEPVVYRINLEDALLIDHQIQLRPGDRVVIAPTGLSTASRYMQQVLPFLAGAQALGLAVQGGTNAATQAAALAPEAAQ
ncbi:MAG: polysaccharide biosynthesis/export family protein [Nannocystaceae bacterium]|nr:polysaccharide biosynthesis/export family protein [bacterium]